MLFNKKWIYVLKRISNGAHKIIFMILLPSLSFSHLLTLAHILSLSLVVVVDLWFNVHIVYRVSTQLIEQSSGIKKEEEEEKNRICEEPPYRELA